MEENRSLLLPLDLTTPVDLFRAINELEYLEDYFQQASVREPGKPISPPQTSRMIEKLASSNGLNLLSKYHREQLIKRLLVIRSKMVVVHVSFAVSPTKFFVEKILTWFRQNIHQYTLIQIGLQPNIVAGCVVKTSKRTYDLSLRRRFAETKLDLTIQ